jgi:hypothetical protein
MNVVWGQDPEWVKPPVTAPTWRRDAARAIAVWRKNAFWYNPPGISVASTIGLWWATRTRLAPMEAIRISVTSR